MPRSFFILCVVVAATCAGAAETGTPGPIRRDDYAVVEFRRYTIKQGERRHFAARFENFFPAAIQQTGALVAGEFFERGNQAMFTWIRCFRDLDDRARVNAALYYGPVWKEHRTQMNELLIDSDNVLLLHPVDPQRGLAVLPAVDPASDGTKPRGIVVAHVFQLAADRQIVFQQHAKRVFEAYRAAGAYEVGLLISLEVANNFPQLPIRTDGPHLVWLGILSNEEMLEKSFRKIADRAAESLSAAGLVRSSELIVLDPAPFSRLRWLPGW